MTALLPSDPGSVVEVGDRRIDAIAREVLTWIERLEADAVAFGIVEATTRGTEIVAQFAGRAVEGRSCTEADVLQALRVLWDAQQLVVLQGNPLGDPAEWVFRSRIGELVRLLSHLKQRFTWTQIPDAKPLVADLTWEVRPRRYPRRDIALSDYLASLDAEDRAIVFDALTRFWRARQGTALSAYSG